MWIMQEPNFKSLDESKKYLVQLLLLTLCDDSGSLSWGCSHIGVKDPEMKCENAQKQHL